MDITNNNLKRELSLKLYQSKIRVLTNHPFFGILLMEFQFKLSDEEKTFSTDGESITFNPSFLKDLTPTELDFAILHEIMHTVLKHPFRKPKTDKKNLFHVACDIVVNSSILESNPNMGKNFTFQGRKIIHLAPNGKEGSLYSADEVYQMLLKDKNFNHTSSNDKDDDEDDEVENYSVDSNQVGDTHIDLKTPYFDVVSNRGGKEYLKEGNVDDYNLGFDFSKITIERGNEFLNHKLFDETNAITYQMDIVFKQDSDMLLIPNYADPHDISVASYKGSIHDGDRFSFNYKHFPFNKDDINVLTKHGFSDADLTDEEDKYYESVKQEFLFVSPDLSNYLQTVIQDYQLDISDPNIVIKVRNLIASWAMYDMKYTPTPQGEDEVIFFMTKSLKGKCTHFASAATMLYRELGIPSRVAVGYHPSLKAGNSKTVYLEEGHAWVEIYIPKVGWVSVDPTPVVSNGNTGKGKSGNGYTPIDSCKNWSENNTNQEKEDEMDQKMLQSAEIHNNSKSKGIIPGNIQMKIMEMKNPKIDWKEYLNNFVQENIIDYSFCPPDKRFGSEDFILPSFSEPEETIKNILFMVDVSGSMSDEDISQCFSEIQNAITMFNGKIEGHVGFFDTSVRGVTTFDGDTNIMEIKPIGRGGTNFQEAFNYVKNHMSDNLPSSIIILTDGYDFFPAEESAMGIPVLWVITNEESNPPWGDVVRLLDNVKR